MLTFAVFDAEQRDTLVAQGKSLKAWEGVLKDKQALNLTEEQLEYAKSQSQSAMRAFEATLLAGYKWALLPRRAAVRDGDRWTLSDERWEALDLSATLAATGGLARKVTGALQHHELLLTAWSPMFLQEALDRWFWSQGLERVSVRALWDEYLSRYVYFPRLKDREVLAKTVREGATTTDFFGYATGFLDGKYVGLKFGERPGSVLFDSEAVIVRKDVAAAAVTAPPRSGGAGHVAESGLAHPGEGAPPAPPRLPTRFYGRAVLNVNRLSSSAGTIGEEVVRHLAGLLDAEVEVTLEIRASVKDGIPEGVRRTVGENANTLKFDSFEFYEE